MGDGEGPFLWLSAGGSPRGYWALPPGGLCLSVFLFVRRGREILLGRYADVPEWERLTGLDEGRRRAHGAGWTVPASHLKFGEDPRAGARRVAEDVLGMRGLAFSEPRVETDTYVLPRLARDHMDFWFLVDAQAPEGTPAPSRPWYRELAWRDPATMRPEEYGRHHEDVVERWLSKGSA